MCRSSARVFQRRLLKCENCLKSINRYERTVVPRVESDANKEMPLIDPSVLDLVPAERER